MDIFDIAMAAKMAKGSGESPFPAYPNLIYAYTHTSNKEVHPTAVDIATGVWTAEGHGLSNNKTVHVVVNAPYHLNKPYNYLPGGLKIGADNGKGQFAKQYYVTVVDEDTFTLSESEGGEAITFTEVSTMDLSKFHFGPRAWNDITISNLPQSTELLLVVKGRMINGHRYLSINNASTAGAKGFDDDTYVNIWGNSAQLFLGAAGGWGSMYLTAEIKFIEDRHVLMTVTYDTMSFASDNSSVVGHVRKYVHHYMTQDYFDQIKLHIDGMLANGTTVEVYAK